MHKKYSPENTIIAFDFHDVLVNYNWSKIIKIFWSNNRKFKLFITLLNPLIWWDIIKLKYQKAVSEQYIVLLGQKYKNLEPYIPLGIEIANTQKINPKMLNLLKNLKLMGYELQLFSNIGGVIIQDAISKFPEIFDCFSKIIVPSQENKYIRKPFDSAFINYLQENNNKISKKYIFIDDKSKNTKKAEKFGILGIRFKNYDQLIQEFKKLGILK
ncbi:MAG: hypothetical protein UR12_C0009G0025 [candidate division TM6 bacterium GW2011_GWF2_30_66]|jgi:FMN phosphatase YigB (HAD superfamily)|nr:MAG: hypothetical protein UR12_C0009G0025 [candidate division TM6 bacterium GW2011_GWF2_30_66]